MNLNADFVDKLRNSGLRPTKQRLKICEVLFNIQKKLFILQLMIFQKL